MLSIESSIESRKLEDTGVFEFRQDGCMRGIDKRNHCLWHLISISYSECHTCRNRCIEVKDVGKWLNQILGSMSPVLSSPLYKKR